MGMRLLFEIIVFGKNANFRGVNAHPRLGMGRNPVLMNAAIRVKCQKGNSAKHQCLVSE